MYRTLIIILFLLAGVKLLSSEHCVNYSFTQLSIEQGLSQSTAQSILLDHKGTLWIGTKSGLNSYTQEGIKTYLHHSGDPHSLPSNYINHLTEDSLGNFWIATSKGLALSGHNSKIHLHKKRYKCDGLLLRITMSTDSDCLESKG